MASAKLAGVPCFHHQGHLNVTITNNRFLDIAWVDSGLSIAIEQFIIVCPNRVYSKFIIENNTIGNSEEPRLSCIYFQVNLDQSGEHDLVIRNNRFYNV
jgi:hypothetical protein